MKKEMKRIFGAVAIAIAVSMFAFGCAKPVKVDPGAAAQPAPTDTRPSQTPWEPTHTWPGPSAAESLSDTGDADLAVLEGRTSTPLLPVYFDFDRSNIRPDQEERIVKNGNYLLDNMRVRIRIEGNTDERGTREYNMALGERRAMSAKKYLLDLGVAGGRIDTISFGEERPISFGHDELSWSQNRRADFLILK